MNQFTSPYYPQNRLKTSNMDWIIVQSLDQVESVAVQPSNKAWIMVQNEPIFALRTADMMGLCTTEYYKFEKCDPVPKATGENYVTMEQLNKSIEEVKEAINESIVKLANTGTEPTKSVKRKTELADA